MKLHCGVLTRTTLSKKNSVNLLIVNVIIFFTSDCMSIVTMFGFLIEFACTYYSRGLEGEQTHMLYVCLLNLISL